MKWWCMGLLSRRGYPAGGWLTSGSYVLQRGVSLPNNACMCSDANIERRGESTLDDDHLLSRRTVLQQSPFGMDRGMQVGRVP